MELAELCEQYEELYGPTSWVDCPYCDAKPHSPCVTSSGQEYPMGQYHAGRKNLEKRHAS